jgi:hypothetical protein
MQKQFNSATILLIIAILICFSTGFALKGQRIKFKGDSIEVISDSNIINSSQAIVNKDSIIKEMTVRFKDGIFANVSENSKLVAIHQLYKKQPFIEVFNPKGKLLGNYNVIKYDKVAIANDGKFIVFGLCPTQHEEFESGIAFYSSNGNLLKHITIKADEIMGKVSSLRNVFIEIHRISMTINQEISAIVGCYDLCGNKLWEYPIAYITHFNEKTLSLDEVKGQIILKVYFKKEKMTEYKKMTFILDLSGKLITEKEGW